MIKKRKTLKKVRVSILIPNYNSKETIKQVLNSLLSSIKNSEIIFCDDASSDNSLKVIKEFVKEKKKKLKQASIEIALYLSDKHLGVGAMRNKCIDKSSGEYLVFMDSDVIINKKAINKLTEGLRKADITFLRVLFPNKRIMYPLLKYEKEYPLISTCFAIKRKSLNKLNYAFDPFYMSGMEDTDFFIRCNLNGLKARFINDAEVIHLFKERSHSDERYYYEVRGLVYAIKKLRPYLKETKLKHSISYITLMKHFVCGVFNFNWTDWSAYNREENQLRKVMMLFKKHPRISEKGSLHLLRIYLHALFDGLRQNVPLSNK